MTLRIRSGIQGLDTILEGGFLRHNSILLKGAPGTGKTSLGVKTLLQGIIEDNEPGIICSFEQFPQQLYRDMKSFGWDLEKLAKEKKLFLFFLKPEDVIVPEGSAHSPILSRFFDLAEEFGARRLLVDSVTHFYRVSPDPMRCRALLLNFINEIKSAGITPILTAEMMNSGERDYSAEEYLVDELLMLRNEPQPRGRYTPVRTVEIAKSRGHGHISGRHPFFFTSKGIEVFPHIPAKSFGVNELSECHLTPVSSGVPGIDRMLGGGLMAGTATIVAGMSGTFKTTLAASFLAEGAKAGERSLYITFQEMPQHLIKMVGQRGVDLKTGISGGKIVIKHYIPDESCLDAIFCDLQSEIAKGGLTRVVIDSLNDFERSLEYQEMAEEYLCMFLSALKRGCVTVLLTQTLDQVSTANPIADVRYASMVDGVIYLGNVEIESRIRKVVSVLKTRGQKAETDLREIQCDGEGLRITSRFHGLTGILQGTARGQLKETVENIFQPLYFIRDFAKMGAGEKATAEQRQKILLDIARQVDSLDGALKEHFDYDPEGRDLES